MANDSMTLRELLEGDTGSSGQAESGGENESMTLRDLLEGDSQAAADQGADPLKIPDSQLKEAGIDTSPDAGMGEFTKGLAKGTDELQATGGGAIALAGGLVGSESLKETGAEIYQEQMQEARQYEGEVEHIDEGTESLGKFWNWTLHNVGRGLPSLAASMAGGGLGGAAAKTAVSAAGKRAAKKAAKEAGEDVAQSTAKKQVTQDTLDKAGTIGGTAGAVGTSTGIEGGSTYMQMLKETNADRPELALAAGVASGALDAVLPLATLNKVGGDKVLGKIREDIADRVAGSRMAGRILKEGAKGGGTEGLTEGSQSIIQEATLAAVDENKELFTDEQLKQLRQDIAAGAVVGAPVGGVSGAFDQRGKAERQPKYEKEQPDVRPEDAPEGENVVGPEFEEVAPGVVRNPEDPLQAPNQYAEPIFEDDGETLQGWRVGDTAQRTDEPTGSAEPRQAPEDDDAQPEPQPGPFAETTEQPAQEPDQEPGISDEAIAQPLDVLGETERQDVENMTETAKELRREILREQERQAPDEAEGGPGIQPGQEAGPQAQYETPETVAPTPETAPPTEQPDPQAIQPDDVRRKTGDPFKSERAAKAALRSRKDVDEDSHQVAPVNGGYVLRSRTAGEPVDTEPVEGQKEATDAQQEPLATDEATEDTGEPAQDEPLGVEGTPIREAPIDELQLSPDVPQFKAGADESGVVDPLGGNFDRTGVAPIQVWVRNDGSKEVVTGRHRLELARRSGEQTIPAQYHYESEGFDKEQAIALDGILNIRDGQGEVKDYVKFFQSTDHSREQAEKEGLTARNKGRRGFEIAESGSELLVEAHQADQIGDEAAYRIAKAAPNDERLQSLGLKQIQQGQSIAVAENTMRAVQSMGGSAEQGDMFGLDDSAMREAEQLAKAAAKRQKGIQERISAVQGAAKRPEKARAEGVDVQDPEAINQRIQELKQERERWEKWHTDSELVQQLREDAELAPQESTEQESGEQEPPQTEQAPDEQDAFDLTSPSEQDLRQQQERRRQAEQQRQEDEQRFEADQQVDSFELKPEGGQGQPVDAGQTDGFQTTGASAQNQDTGTGRTSEWGSKNTVFTEDSRQQALEVFRKNAGKVHSGIDPELFQAGVRLAGFHIEAGARKFSDFVQNMVTDLGDMAETFKPYLKQWYEGVRMEPALTEAGITKEMTPHDEVVSTDIDEVLANAPSTDTDLERDSGDTDAQDGLGPDDVSQDAGSAGRGAGGRGGRTGGRGAQRQGNRGVSGGEAAASGERGDQSVRGGERATGAQGQSAGGAQSGRGRSTDGSRAQSGGQRKGRAPSNAGKSTYQQQLDAENVPVTPADLDNIRETLPALMPKQHEDVLGAEKRYFQDNGLGMMFTNGTGTGKTFTGLGIAKRFEKQGKNNILILAPSQKKVGDWINDAKNVALNVSALPDTNSHGEGVVATTYANLADNETLVDRDWDLIIADESHQLSQNQEGAETGALSKLRAIARHRRGGFQRAWMRHRGEKQTIENKKQQKYREFLPQADLASEADRWAQEAVDHEWQRLVQKVGDEARAIEDENNENTSRVTLLSATPFAYDKTVDYAEGFLFDYPEENQETIGGWSHVTPYEQFMMTHFGYRKRYGKLTRPEAEVDRSLLERNFHEWLKKQGSLMGRVLDLEQDYSRDFVKVESELGEKIDEALEYLRESTVPAVDDDGNPIYDAEGNQAYDKKYRELEQFLTKQNFAYQRQTAILESIKAGQSIDRVRDHLNLGRKVVVFHDFVNTEMRHPFQLTPEQQAQADDEVLQQYERLKADRPDITEMDLGEIENPVDLYRETFGDKLAVFNGREPKKAREQAVEQFNKDDSGVDVILVQSEAGKEGISLHDTTGNKPRAEVNLGLPARPTTSIQAEGRIYRIGNATNAIFEYMTTGTRFEEFLFGSRISQRASTAENLAMGNMARDLARSFTQGYADAEAFAPNENQGTGGKQADQTIQELDEFDKARTYYYAQGRRSQPSGEGADYFATPEPLGLKMVEWLKLDPNERALEPSAGHGAIAQWLPESTSNTFVEPAYRLQSKLRLNAGDGRLVEGRFEDLDKRNKFDGIAMNPPFGHGGKTAMEHVQKAVEHLRDGGRLVTIIPDGPAMQRRWDKWYEDAEGVYEVADVSLPSVTFHRAATQVKARIKILERHKEARDVQQKTPVDLSDQSAIEDFFEAIRGMDMPDRVHRDADTQSEAMQAQAEGPLEAHEFSHTQTGETVYIARPKQFVGREWFDDWLKRAKMNGGWYNRYNRGEAVKGFAFKDAESRDNFMQEVARATNEASGVEEGGGDYRVEDEVHAEQGRAETGGARGAAVPGAVRVYENRDGARGQLELDFEAPTQAQQTAKEITRLTRTRKVQTGTFQYGIDKVKNPADAAHVLAPLRRSGQEIMAALVTDEMGHPLSVIEHSRGTTNSAAVERGILAGAINNIEGAAHVYLAHNHPGGDPTQSDQDMQVTSMMGDALTGSGVMLQGMIVVSPGGKASFYEGQGLASHPIEPTQQPRRQQLPSYGGRQIVRASKAEAVDNPNKMAMAMDSLGNGQEGLLLINNQGAPTAFVPMSAEELKQLKTGDLYSGSASILRTVEETNANVVAMRIHGEDQKAVLNTKRLANAAGLNFWDALVGPDATSKHAEGSMPATYSTQFESRVGDVKPTGQKRRMSVKQVQNAVRQDLGVPVQVVQSVSEIPGGAHADTAGLFAGGQVYLVADNIQNAEHARKVHAHEVVGHYGMMEMLGSEFDSILKEINRLKRRGNRQIRGLTERVQKTHGTLDSATEAAEIIAKMAEDKTTRQDTTLEKLWRMIRRAVRAFAQSVGVKTPLTVADIDAMLDQATKHLKGRPRGQSFYAPQLPTLGWDDLEGIRLFSRAPDDIQKDMDQVHAPVHDENEPWATKIRKGINEKLSRWDSLIQGAVDQWHRIAQVERLQTETGGLMEGSESATKAAMRTKNLHNVMAAVMHKGTLELVNGGVQLKRGSKGFLDIFKDVASAGLLREWEHWAGAQRAKRLRQEGRERLYTDKMIVRIDRWVENNPEIKQMFEQAHQEWQQFNKDMLDFAESAGLIDPEARAVWEHDDYVPFHRVHELNEAQQSDANQPGGGLANQTAGIRRLSGGVERVNIMDNMVSNTAALVDASFKNIAMQRVVDLTAAQDEDGNSLGMTKIGEDTKADEDEVRAEVEALGIDWDALEDEQKSGWAKLVQNKKRLGEGVVRVKRGGKGYLYRVDDPLIYRAVSSMGPESVQGVMRLFRFSKRLLTKGVTSTPGFMTANYVRDTLQTWVAVREDMNPMRVLGQSLKGMKEAFQEEDKVWEIMAGGGGGLGFYDDSLENTHQYLSELDKKRVLNTPHKIWEFWRKIGGATENANRLAAYEQAIKDGYSHAEAVDRAQDILNFSNHGDWQAMRTLTEIVPFMNARIQGLERLIRGGRENPGKFALKGSLITGASMALLASNWDDERYWQLPEWDKDAYWHFWIGDEHYRLPKPFEVGALFGTVPERMAEMMGRTGDGWLFTSRMAHMFTDTFAMNPIPQLLKPPMEQAMNHQMYFGTPILNYDDKGVDPEAQYDPWTSHTLRAVAEGMPDFAPDWMRSPKRLKHLIRGYTGTLGSYAVSLADMGVKTLDDDLAPQPEKHLQRYPVMSRFVQDAVPRTKHTQRFYRMLEQANQVHKTMQTYAERGRREDAKRRIKEGRQKAAVRDQLESIANTIGQLRDRADRIWVSRNMSPAAKRRRLDEIERQINELTRQASEQYWDRFQSYSYFLK